MIRALNIALNAAHPELPLPEAVVFESSPTALFIRGVPRRVGKWALTAVRVAMTRPDGSVATRSAVESAGGVWTVTLPGSPAAGRTAAGMRIYADGEDETGAAVTGYVLGFADLEIKPLSAAPTPAPGTDAHEMWYYDEEPDVPRKGDVCEIAGALKYYDGEAWQSFGSRIDGNVYISGSMQVTGSGEFLGGLRIIKHKGAPLAIETTDSDLDLYSIEFGIFDNKWQFKFKRIGEDDPTVFYLALPFASGEIATTAAVINAVYPVGAIYVSVSPTSPATLFGIGTWKRITGRFLLAATDDGESGAEQAAGRTGGEASHTLTVNEMPSHTHGSRSLTGSWSTEGWNGVGGSGIVSRASSNYNRKSPGSGNLLGNTKFNIDATHEHSSAGEGQEHNNMPPYLSVYMWKRTA